MRRIKRLAAMLLCALLALSCVSGCGAKKPLQIWVSSSIGDFGKYGAQVHQYEHEGFQYELTIFSDESSASDSMGQTQTLQSQLMAGTGPDVILFTDYDFGDVQKLGTGGCFLDVSEFLENSEALDPADYAEGILYAGFTGDACYYLPLGYSVVNLTTTQWVLDEMDWEMAEDTAVLMTQAMEFGEDPRGFRSMFSPMAGPEADTVFELLLWASGLELVDHRTGEVLPDEEGLRHFLEGYRAILDTQWRQRSPSEMVFGTGEYWGNLLLERRFAYCCLFMLGMSLDPYLQFGENQQPYLTVLGDLRGGIAGHVNGYAAINANTSDPEAAWAFVETLLGESVQSRILADKGAFMDMPVRRGLIGPWIVEYNRRDGGDRLVDLSGVSHILGVLDDETIRRYTERAESAVASYNSPPVFHLLLEKMMPYLEGTSDYETCLAELRATLELYAAE